MTPGCVRSAVVGGTTNGNEWRLGRERVMVPGPCGRKTLLLGWAKEGRVPVLEGKDAQ